MFNKPTKRKKLYAVIVDNELVGIFPTKKMTNELNYTSTKTIVELFWNGGFYGKELDMSYRTMLAYKQEEGFDF